MAENNDYVFHEDRRVIIGDGEVQLFCSSMETSHAGKQTQARL